MQTKSLDRVHKSRHRRVPVHGIDARLVSAETSNESAERETFINAMRGAATGVNLITTEGPAGRFGLTVSAFSSVSADPPMVLVCINRRSPANAAVRNNGRFCVNVLSAEQRDLADTFAGRPIAGAPYDFAAARWNEDRRDLPSLADAVANFHCMVDHAVESGSHTVFIGRVTHAAGSARHPLIYTGSAYGRACPDAQTN